MDYSQLRAASDKLGLPEVRKRPLRLVLMCLFLAFVVDGTWFEVPHLRSVSSWSRVGVSPDSMTYVLPFTRTRITPPVYHAFTQLRHLFGEPEEGHPKGGEHNLSGQSLGEKLHHPMFRIVWLQKLFFVGTLFVLTAALSAYLPALVSAVTVFAMYKANVFSTFSNFVLTECLAQAFLCLAAALTLWFFKTKRPGLIIVIGLICAIGYLNRPAAASTAILLGTVGLVGALTDWRRYLWPSVAGVALLGSAYLFEAKRIPEDSQAVAINVKFMQAYMPYVYALLVAQPEDVDLFEDKLSRDFLLEAIRLREQHGMREPDEPFLIRVHIPVTDKFGIPRYSAMAADFYEQLAPPILEKRWVEHLKLRWHAFMIATSRMSSWSLMPFWLGALAVVVTALLARTPLAWFGLATLGVHLANCAIMVVFMVPLPRYVEATQFLLLLGLLCSAWALAQYVEARVQVRDRIRARLRPAQ